MIKSTLQLCASYSAAQFAQATQWTDWVLEDVSYAMGFVYRINGSKTILVREVLKPDPSEIERSRYRVEPSPEFLCRLLDKAQTLGAGCVIQHHTHPFCEHPDFSGTDDEAAYRLQHDLQQINPQVEIIQVVHGRDNRQAKARILDTTNDATRFVYFDDIMLTGPAGIQKYSGTQSANSPTHDAIKMTAQEERNARAFGANGVDALHNIRVLLLGTGGLGSALAYQLSRLGFRHVTVYDCQRIEATNINRFYFVTKPRTAIGRFKASYVARGMRLFNPTGKYRAINASIFDERIASDAIKESDIVVMAVDHDAPRCVAMALAARYGKPLVNVSNAIYLDELQKIKGAFVSCQWFIPREDNYPCLRCQGGINDKEVEAAFMSERLKRLRQKAGYVVGTPESPNAQVIPINSAAAGIAAWELAAWACGIRPPSPWIHYDLMNNSFQVLQGSGNPDCTICGSSPASCLATGDADGENLPHKG